MMTISVHAQPVVRAFHVLGALGAALVGAPAALAQYPDVLSPVEVGAATVAAIEEHWPEFVREAALGGLAGTWSSPLTTPDDAAWAIEDFICFIACTPQARAAATAMLADPENSRRPAISLVPDVMALNAREVSGLRGADAPHALEVAAHAPVGGETAELGCEPYGVATQIVSPLPLRIEQRPGRVLLRYEEYGALRTVLVDGRGDPSADFSLDLGLSVGRFDGDSFVIETNEIPPGRFHLAFGGGPYSEKLRIVERYTVSDDGDWLFLTLRIEDPATLAAPLLLIKSWRRTPDVELLPYSCDAVSGQR